MSIFEWRWCLSCDRATVDINTEDGKSFNTCCAAWFDVEGPEWAAFLKWKKDFPKPLMPSEKMARDLIHRHINDYKNLTNDEILVMKIFINGRPSPFLNNSSSRVLRRWADLYHIDMPTDIELIKIWISDLVRQGISPDELTMQYIKKKFNEDVSYLVK